MSALRFFANQNWTGLGGLWSTALLQECHVFMQKSTLKIFLSLGFVHQAAMAWELEELGETSLILVMMNDADISCGDPHPKQKNINVSFVVFCRIEDCFC